MRVIPALLLAFLSSLPFVVTVSNASESGSWRFWGSVLGAFTVVAVFGTSLWILNRKTKRGPAIGRVVAATLLTLIGGFFTWLAVVYGVPPFSAGGLAVYPVTLAPVVLGLLVLKSGGRVRRHSTDEAPSSAGR